MFFCLIVSVKQMCLFDPISMEEGYKVNIGDRCVTKLHETKINNVIMNERTGNSTHL